MTGQAARAHRPGPAGGPAMFMGDAALNLKFKASEKKNMEHHVGRTKSPEFKTTHLLANQC